MQPREQIRYYWGVAYWLKRGIDVRDLIEVGQIWKTRFGIILIESIDRENNQCWVIEERGNERIKIWISALIEGELVHF